MKQKVEIIQAGNVGELGYKLNKFAETHHIESISYAIKCGELDYTWHYCVVMYTNE